MANKQAGLPAAQTIRICDDIATIDDAEKRASRIINMQEKLDVSPEQIQATFAWIKIRRQNAVGAIRALLNDRRNMIDQAHRGVAIMEHRNIEGGNELAELLATLEKQLNVSKEGLTLLKNAHTEQELLGVIEKFAEAQDNELLKAIAEIYSTKRPDIAVRALLKANLPIEAAALTTQHQCKENRTLITKLLQQIGEVL